MIVAVISPVTPEWTADVARLLARDGGSLAVFTANDVAGRADRLMHRLAACVADTYGHHSTLPTRRLADRIERLMPDVVHITALETDFFNYPMLLDRLAALPVEILVTASRGVGSYFAIIRRPGYNRRITTHLLATLPRITVCDEVTDADTALELYNKLIQVS